MDDGRAYELSRVRTGDGAETTVYLVRPPERLDQRSGVDAGLELGELAQVMLSFGAREAINLDGGGSATLVHRGHLLNRPYSDHDQPAPESRPVVTALLFDPA